MREMPDLPNEILDRILEHVHPYNTPPWVVDTRQGVPLDTRFKSNHDALLRRPTLRYLGRPNSQYKQLRLVFPHYYSRMLFQTVLIYPHSRSLRKAIRVSRSSYARFVQRVVIHLPFFTKDVFLSHGEGYAAEGFWLQIPQDLTDILGQFINLRAIVVLPSWDHRQVWLEQHGDQHHSLSRVSRDWDAMIRPMITDRIKSSELENIAQLFLRLTPLSQVRHLHIFNLGTEWIPYLTPQANIDWPDPAPLSPATVVSLERSRQGTVRRLVIRSCTLHDLIWFTPVYVYLEELHLEDISARHSGEVELFSATFDRFLFPSIKVVTIRFSDLCPADYLDMFGAMRDNGPLARVVLSGIHLYCPSSVIGAEFVFDSWSPRGDIQYDLCRYLRNEETAQFGTSWLEMFRKCGYYERFLMSKAHTKKCPGCFC